MRALNVTKGHTLSLLDKSMTFGTDDLDVVLFKNFDGSNLRVPNTTLWKTTKQLPIENEIKKRKWRWIGHTLRKPPETVTRQAITWNPPGKRRRGRTRNSWQRHRKRYEGDGMHQERNGEDGHRQKTVAVLSRWPMLRASEKA